MAGASSELISIRKDQPSTGLAINLTLPELTQFIDLLGTDIKFIESKLYGIDVNDSELFKDSYVNFKRSIYLRYTQMKQRNVELHANYYKQTSFPMQSYMWFGFDQKDLLISTAMHLSSGKAIDVKPYADEIKLDSSDMTFDMALKMALFLEGNSFEELKQDWIDDKTFWKKRKSRLQRNYTDSDMDLEQKFLYFIKVRDGDAYLQKAPFTDVTVKFKFNPISYYDLERLRDSVRGSPILKKIKSKGDFSLELTLP
jgi:hypothetical protein